MPTIRHACLSDLGKTHEANEDRWYADPAFGLYLVSDGMAYAEPAQLVVDLLPDLLRSHLTDIADLTEPAAASVIQHAIRQVSRKIRSLAVDEPEKEWQGLGATIVLALVRPPQALLAHLGDSRIYRHRAGRLQAMTSDHSVLEGLIQVGKLAREDAQRYAFNGGPTRFAGMAGDAHADTRLLELQAGDRLLLCSDGLTCMLREDTIETILNEQPEPEEACQALVEAANAAGGDDNITVLIVELTDPAP
jgi:protein phosphatase